MDFVDELTFWAHGGKGGDGCVSFRRERFVPKGGPDGGDGGDGGSVILNVNTNLTTLFDLRHRKKYTAESGARGKGKRMNGKNGKNTIIRVPKGTLVIAQETGEILGDLKEKDQKLIVAKGGRRGKGNARFATPTWQAPDFAEKGAEGEKSHLRLELKLLADVGLVGFPNAGKSKLLSRISAAKPKIADYPFTTLVPNLGIVSYNEYRSFVVADIPGLIKGAHLGKGLGDRFLRHIERTSILLFLIDSTSECIDDVYNLLIHELENYDRSLIEKPGILALSKVDLLSEDAQHKLPQKIHQIDCFPISAVTGAGIQNLIDAIVSHLSEPKHG